MKEMTESQRQEVQQLQVGIVEEIDRLCRKHNLRYSLAYGTLIGAVRHDGFIPWDDDIDICMPRSDYDRLKDICKTELNKKYFYQSNETDPNYWLLYNKVRINNTLFVETASYNRDIHQGVYIDIFPIDNVPDDDMELKRHIRKFSFYRTGVQSKHIALMSRHGKKMFGVIILRALYSVFSLKYLHKKAQEEATKYNNHETKRMMSTCSGYLLKDVFLRESFLNFINHRFEGKTFLIYKDYDRVLSQIYGNYMQLPPEENRVTRHPLVDIRI